MKYDVLLAFGSNLGDRRRTIEAAWAKTALLPDTEAVAISRFYETRAVGGPAGQPDYLNAAGHIRTGLEPRPLLERLQEIEHRLGRIRTEHWGARTLDIDILLYADRIVTEPTLRIPHPEMLRRRFVLEPAQDIAPDMRHPAAELTIAEALAALILEEDQAAPESTAAWPEPGGSRPA